MLEDTDAGRVFFLEGKSTYNHNVQVICDQYLFQKICNRNITSQISLFDPHTVLEKSEGSAKRPEATECSRSSCCVRISSLVNIQQMSSPMLILSIIKKPTSIEKLQTEDRPFWKTEYRIIIYYIGDEFLFV